MVIRLFSLTTAHISAMFFPVLLAVGLLECSSLNIVFSHLGNNWTNSRLACNSYTLDALSATLPKPLSRYHQAIGKIWWILYSVFCHGKCSDHVLHTFLPSTDVNCRGELECNKLSARVQQKSRSVCVNWLHSCVLFVTLATVRILFDQTSCIFYTLWGSFQSKYVN